MIAAEGEQKASRALKEAADVISQSPSALQLRFLQTLTQISAEKNSTIVFPIPVEILSAFGSKWVGGGDDVDVAGAFYDNNFHWVIIYTDVAKLTRLDGQ